jgi:hypothetical protein
MKKIFIFSLVLPLFLPARAQVPVSKEPRHHDVLDNAWVRLLDVHIPPGDTSQFHIHETPSVFLILSDAKTGSQVIQEEDRSKSPVHDYGNIWFEGFYKLPRIHRVWNGDTSEFHVMDIELPNKNYIPIDSPIRQAAFTLLFEEKPVRVYRLKLDPHQGISLHPRKANILLIQTGDSVITTRVNLKSLSQKADFIYIPSGQSIDLKNEGARKSEFVFFELK